MTAITAAEAATTLGVSRSTVYRRIHTGKIAAVKVNRRWQITLPAPAAATRSTLNLPPAPKPVRANQYASTCADCQDRVPAGAGRLTGQPGAWKVTHQPGMCNRDARFRPATKQAAKRHGHSSLCAECSTTPGRYWRQDSSGIGGQVCGRCSRQPSYTLSFA